MRNETSAFYFRESELTALANGASLLSSEQRTSTIKFLQSFITKDLFYNSNSEEQLTLAWHCFTCLKALDGFDKYETILFNSLKHAPNIQHMDLQDLEAFSSCWALIKNHSPDKYLFSDIAEHLNNIRCSDQGWSHIKRAPQSSIYGSWLAFSIFQSIEKAIPDELKVIKLLDSMKAKDEAYAHQRSADHGSVASTYFAICLLKSIEEEPSHKLTHWLNEQQADDGGFVATHIMPFGDINSTALALQSLKLLQADITLLKPAALTYIRDHYQQDGGFIAHCRETTADPSSTYYALMALGHVDDYLRA
ncbi:terpene cyclase/mutase family protein [Lentisphaera profundi]|uniref:Terpene cyclase/mutase family protein n=1 Tax=Lentisphaera profundi TaxID=1658616 RepID=A0ABY7VX23_9BACT|nr:prenyltransferase/squalene oxidase repeat-containing protein [Lentisphaera profundi]WDE98272.1 terpene cyclase/mutase family protein [Lentisphaera profundi]